MNFHEVFKPLYILLSCHGLFPYSVKYNNTKYYGIIKKSVYVNALCAVSISVVVFLFGILHVQFIYTSNEDGRMVHGFLTKINYAVELFTLIAFCIITYICFYINRYTFVRILNKSAKLIESTTSHDEAILKMLCYKIKLVVILLPLAMVLPVALNFSRPDSFWKMILVMFNYMVPQTIQFIVTGYFYIFFQMIDAVLQYIKESISNIANEKTLMNSFIKVETRATAVLKHLERMYVEVLELKQEINRIFQAPLFMSSIQCFHSLVSQSYIIYHGGVVEGNMKTHDFINCSCWLPYQIFKIFVLAYTGHTLKIQIENVGKALLKLPTQKDDIKLLIEIQHFSSLMRYYGDELSVYGLFPLDATLMFKVITSATMYLIILVQFDKKTDVI